MSQPGDLTDSLSADLAGWLQLLESRHPVEIDLGLERCARVYRRMGAPRPARKVVTVGGTNGKGSSVAYLSAMATALGYSSGTYTSPHLLNYNERIQVGGRCATDQQIVAAFELVDRAREDVSLSYFEFGTLAALQVLSGADLDYGMLEVGLGGRLDAVNIVDCDCAVITPIGIDHESYLGNDRVSIGFEKAGIIRPGKPVICGEANPPSSVLETADHVGAQVWCLGRDFHADPTTGVFDFPAMQVSCSLPAGRLAGRHQHSNRAVALAAMLVCEPAAASQADALASGMSKMVLAGRLQVLSKEPTVIVDVGHNTMAASAVAEFLAERRAKCLRAQNRGGRCLCVLGMLADKNAEAVAAALDGQIDFWLCGGLGGARGQTGAVLAGRVAASASHPVEAFGTVTEALQNALSRTREAADKEDLVLVFGSFQTAAAAIAHLGVIC